MHGGVAHIVSRFLGKGKRLFEDTEETKAMKLVSTKQVGQDGVLILTYRLARRVEAGGSKG